MKNCHWELHCDEIESQREMMRRLKEERQEARWSSWILISCLFLLDSQVITSNGNPKRLENQDDLFLVLVSESELSSQHVCQSMMMKGKSRNGRGSGSRTTARLESSFSDERRESTEDLEDSRQEFLLLSWPAPALLFNRRSIISRISNPLFRTLYFLVSFCKTSFFWREISYFLSPLILHMVLRKRGDKFLCWPVLQYYCLLLSSSRRETRKELRLWLNISFLYSTWKEGSVRKTFPREISNSSVVLIQLLFFLLLRSLETRDVNDIPSHRFSFTDLLLSVPHFQLHWIRTKKRVSSPTISFCARKRGSSLVIHTLILLLTLFFLFGTVMSPDRVGKRRSWTQRRFPSTRSVRRENQESRRKTVKEQKDAKQSSV